MTITDTPNRAAAIVSRGYTLVPFNTDRGNAFIMDAIRLCAQGTSVTDAVRLAVPDEFSRSRGVIAGNIKRLLFYEDSSILGPVRKKAAEMEASGVVDKAREIWERGYALKKAGGMPRHAYSLAFNALGYAFGDGDHLKAQLGLEKMTLDYAALCAASYEDKLLTSVPIKVLNNIEFLVGLESQHTVQ